MAIKRTRFSRSWTIGPLAVTTLAFKSLADLVAQPSWSVLMDGKEPQPVS